MLKSTESQKLLSHSERDPAHAGQSQALWRRPIYLVQLAKRIKIVQAHIRTYLAAIVPLMHNVYVLGMLNIFQDHADKSRPPKKGKMAALKARRTATKS